MTTKEKLCEIVNRMPESGAESLLKVLADPNSPIALLAAMGTWEDERSDEEIIRDLRESRTFSRLPVEL